MRVVRTLHDNGYDAYLVGGCLRDLILGNTPKDFDIASNANPGQIQSCFANARKIGRRFQIMHVNDDSGQVLEVATFRKAPEDADEPGTLLSFDNVFGTIEEDVHRRDFTMNALYYDIRSEELLDFVGSLADIEQKKIVAIGDPIDRFREDPGRLLRAIRFQSKLNFSIETELAESIQRLPHLIAGLSARRTAFEIGKILRSGSVEPIMTTMVDYGVFSYLFDPIEAISPLLREVLQKIDAEVQQGQFENHFELFIAALFFEIYFDEHREPIHDNEEAAEARNTANAIIEDIRRHVAISLPERKAIASIFQLQSILEYRPNVTFVRQALSNPSLNLAFDVFRLRISLGEVSSELIDWWVNIMTADQAETRILLDDYFGVRKKPRKRRRRRNRSHSRGRRSNFQGSNPH